MAVAFDVTTNCTEGPSDGTLSLNHTPVAGGRVCAVVNLLSQSDINPSTATCTYDGIPMVKRQYEYEGTNNFHCVFTLDDVPPGTKAVVVTCNAVGGAVYMVCSTYKDGMYDTSGKAAAPNGSLALTTVVDGAMVGECMSDGKGTLIESSCTEIYYNSYASGWDVSAAYKLATTTSTTLAWTNGDSVCAVALKPAPPLGGGVAIAPYMML
jgi:hypothetical protein